MTLVQSHHALTLVSLLALGTVAGPALAQAPAPTPAEPPPALATGTQLRQDSVIEEVSGRVKLGVGWFQAGDLDDRLNEHGYDDIDPLAFWLGGSGQLVFDAGFMVGIQGMFAGHDRTNGPDDYDAYLSYSSFRAEGGYAILHSERFLLLPKVGAGWYSAYLHLYNDRDAEFDELIDEPGTTTNLYSAGLLLAGSMAFEVRIPLGDRDGHPGYFLAVGLEGGYLYSVPSGYWTTPTGGKVENGPDASLDGAFGCLTLGGGAFDL